jgi:hypothetical protein
MFVVAVVFAKIAVDFRERMGYNENTMNGLTEDCYEKKGF